MSIKRNLEYLVPKTSSSENAQSQVDTHEWATVTQASPLRIRLDTDTVQLPFTPITLAAGLVLNDRVLVLLMANNNPKTRSKRVIVMGKPQ
jgi:hypothetical protein